MNIHIKEFAPGIGHTVYLVQDLCRLDVGGTSEDTYFHGFLSLWLQTA
jgi:hypothetical protein